MLEETIVRFLEAQGVEAEAEKTRRSLRELPERMASLDSALAALRQELDDIKAEAGKTQELVRVHELELARLKALGESNAVRGKKSRNQREYKAFEKDQKIIETRTQEAEERYLNDMSRLEELKGSQAAMEEAFPEKESAILSDRAALEAEHADKAAFVELSERKRDQIIQGLLPEHVARYRKASEGRPGTALAAVDNSTCLACHMNIPPQLYNELFKNDKIMLCPHCHRIMYIYKNPAFGYVPPEGPEEAKQKPSAGRPRKRGPKDKAALARDEASY
ncbi:MAG: C4-type zinc ribbon domain-containing protein [Deltaproteobacteria bacterium]|jgi:predicted  nucleic acid-binding Zn-ribbon protein|nr:C4-type zinc ribbon domain-containing protein [Deltaproteobacteria bacterium]